MRRPGWSLGQFAGTLTALLLVGFMLVPMPYVSTGPGLTMNVLGSYRSLFDDDEHPVIAIDGHEKYDSDGKLLLTTVEVVGSRESPISLVNVLSDWVSPKRTVSPIEMYYPPDSSVEEIQQANLAQMTSSQNTAAVAALTELGYKVPAKMTIVGTVSRDEAGLDSDEDIVRAEDVIREGDQVLAVDGKNIDTYDQLLDIVKELTPDEPVSVKVKRDGKQMTVEFAPYTDSATVAQNEQTGTDTSTTRLGLQLDPQYDLPVDVSIETDDVGGPSAGLMFTLGIIDLLTEEDLTGGKTIAGTGTVDVDGTVGPIGGIEHKLDGAADAGATWFLAPQGNCSEISRIPDGLEVVAVETVSQARQALENIARGETDALPRC